METDLHTAALPEDLWRGIRRRLIFSLAAVMTAIGGFLAWSEAAPLSSAILAPGMVVPDSRTKTVQHLEGGIVRDILVTDGSKVEPGQDLLVLDDTRVRASVALLTSQFHSALALEARLIAERDGNPDIEFPTELLDAGTVPDVQQALLSETARFNTRREALAGETAILQQRIAQLEEEIRGLQAQHAATEGQLVLLAEEIAVVRQLVDAGHERKPRLLALSRAARQTEGDRGLYVGQIARAHQSIGEARLRISQLNVTRAREIADELKEVRGQLVDLRERLYAAEDTLSRTRIKAPQGGTVVRLGYFTVGGVIAPGAPILDIVPQDDRTIVEARVRPDDIDDLRTGTQAQVRPTAFHARNLRPLSGTVTAISADRLTDRDSGRSYYSARIEIEADSARDLPNGVKALIAGMPAEVIIETRARTFADYVLMPLASSMRRAFRED
jgi:HlyD family type I secretion membrane fusion protein